MELSIRVAVYLLGQCRLCESWARFSTFELYTHLRVRVVQKAVGQQASSV